MNNIFQKLNRQIAVLEEQVSHLKEREKQLELVLKSTGVGVWDWYVQTGEVSFNERWANIIGYKLQEILPANIETWLKYAHPDDLESSNAALKAHWEGKTDYYICESRMRHKNGHWVWVYDTGQVIEWEVDGRPKRMIGTHLDITEKKEFEARLAKANEQLRQLSYVDPLTKIPNRRAYEEKLNSVIEDTQRMNAPLSLFIIDIDKFKQFNDEFGHDAGDKALYRVAQSIRKALPRKTDFIARFGGEEFVVILPFTNGSDAIHVANRILRAIISEKIIHPRSPFNNLTTVSIGVATTCSEHGADCLLENADQALYKAKSNGRNRYEVFSTCN